MLIKLFHHSRDILFVLKHLEETSAESDDFFFFAHRFPIIVPAPLFSLWFLPLIDKSVLIPSDLIVGKFSVKARDYSGFKMSYVKYLSI